MAIQYDAPTTKGDFEQGVLANPSIDPETQAAINERLDITPETAGQEIEVAGGVFNPDTGQVDWTVPPGADAVDAVIIDFGGNPPPPGFTITFPEGLTEVPVVIFDSDQGVEVTFNTIERVIQMGNGDDVVTVTGDQDTTLTGSDGNDTLTTSGGDDNVRGGVGNDSIDGGAGNDFIGGGSGNDTIVSGVGSDTIDGGTGFDTVQVGFDYPGTQTITGDVIFTSGDNAVQVDNVQFVSFTNGHTLTIMDEFDQAAAMRMYQTILGRAADQPGAEFYLDEALEVPDPALVIAAGMLGSAEFTSEHGFNGENLDNTQFVELMYEQGLGRAADQAGLEFYVDQLDEGATRNQIAAEINASDESVDVNSDTVILLDGWV